MSEQTRFPALAALWTFVFGFVGMALSILTGWLEDVLDWAGAEDAVPFPDARPLVKAVVLLAIAAVIAFVNFVVRYAQARGWLRLPGGQVAYTDPSGDH